MGSKKATCFESVTDFGVIAMRSSLLDESCAGISQQNELHSLPELGVYSLGLKYRESRRTDEFGNQFRYKAAVNPDSKDGESKDGRVTYDVFFVEEAAARERKGPTGLGVAGNSLNLGGSYRNGELFEGLTFGVLPPSSIRKVSNVLARHLAHCAMRCDIAIQSDAEGSTLPCVRSALRKNALAAATSLFGLSRKSTVLPSLSTAR
jgi:hypothetical protein